MKNSTNLILDQGRAKKQTLAMFDFPLHQLADEESDAI